MVGDFEFLNLRGKWCVDVGAVRLAVIQEIRLGQKTMVFQKNPLPEYEAFSFSLIYDDRTLDIVCKDKLEFSVWVTGLKSLTVDPQEIKLENASLTASGRMPIESESLSISFKGGQTIVSKREGIVWLFSEIAKNNGWNIVQIVVMYTRGVMVSMVDWVMVMKLITWFLKLFKLYWERKLEPLNVVLATLQHLMQRESYIHGVLEGMNIVDMVNYGYSNFCYI